MATIGLSKPYFALYSASGTTVTYSGGALIGKATQMSISVEAGGENNLYADNGVAESDRKFSSGTVELTVDELSPSVVKSIIGVTEESITSSSVTSAKWYVNDDRQVIPYIGIGGVLKKRVNNADKFQAIILEKVQLSELGYSATTQGESIEWQTPTLNGQVMRDDTTYHAWRRVSSDLDSESDAEAIIKQHFSIT